MESNMTTKSSFVSSHPFHVFDTEDSIDYSERNQHFIQCLKAFEAFMDIDAYILDYMNKKILYVTKGSSLFFENTLDDIQREGYLYFEKFIHEKDIEARAPCNRRVFEYFYSLPLNKRLNFNGYYTYDLRVRDRRGKMVLINQKITILDLTNDGIIRLTLCVISYPTAEKPGNAYLKLNDNSVVWQYIPSIDKFVEVKTQRLTSKAMMILKLASNGKTETEIAEILGISIPTVKYHKKKIFARIGVKNTAEAIQWMNNQKKLVKR